MFFYILLVPVIFASIFMIGRLRRLKRHDKVLYKFCKNRRELMSIIRERNFSLEKDYYFALRELTDETNGAIHFFNEYKPFHFNLRKNIAYLRRLVESKKGIAEIDW